jgi:hypothetical protein
LKKTVEEQMAARSNISANQETVCRRHGLHCESPGAELKVGIARNVRDGIVPINGLRHRPVGDTSGWYIWAGEGEPSEDPEFFVPLHVAHMSEWCPDAVRFLGLPPGCRFLIAGDHEDVWQDPTLLDP